MDLIGTSENTDIPGSAQDLTFNPNQVLPDVPYDSGDLASQKVIDETFELYIFHLSRRIVDMGLKHPLEPLENRECNLSQNAIALKKLANKFARSPQRIRVYEQAQKVDLTTLQFKTFEQLLCGIFQDGDDEIPWKRVLGLFYFCSDLSVKALGQKAVSCFINIYNWTSSYLGVKLAAWVEKQGGWSEVLETSSSSTSYATTLSILGFCCIGILAICIYIRRK